MNANQAKYMIIPLETNRDRVESLCWQGDELIDWVAGGNRYCLDGTITRSSFGYRYKFDKAIASLDGIYAVIYEQLGTKGLILKQGHLLREINRSYYHADITEYPIAIFNLPDGRTVLAHCPDSYCKIEIEEIETGQRLTARDGEGIDFFHSQLQVSPSGRFLLSAGWVWQPWHALEVFNIPNVLSNPTLLDSSWNADFGEEDIGEIYSAVFDSDRNIIFAGDTENENHFIATYSLSENCLVSYALLEEAAGTLMPVDDHVIEFLNYPKLIDSRTGKIIDRWRNLNTSFQNSSIIDNDRQPAVLALDIPNKRFAVAGEGAITVVQF
jgi:hypothetical protein